MDFSRYKLSLNDAKSKIETYDLMNDTEFSEQIRHWDMFDVPEDNFYTSALATAEFLKKQAPGCTAFVIGEAGLLNALYDVGITMNDVNPDYVVVGEGRNYSLESLTKAVNLVLSGAKLIGANYDVSGNIDKGIAPACRALISPILIPLYNSIISWSR